MTIYTAVMTSLPQAAILASDINSSQRQVSEITNNLIKSGKLGDCIE